MSPIVAQEYEALTDWQKSKFHELVAWQTKGNRGLRGGDLGHAQVIQWVKRMEEPPAPPADPEEPVQE